MSEPLVELRAQGLIIQKYLSWLDQQIRLAEDNQAKHSCCTTTSASIETTSNQGLPSKHDGDEQLLTRSEVAQAELTKEYSTGHYVGPGTSKQLRDAKIGWLGYLYNSNSLVHIFIVRAALFTPLRLCSSS